MQTLCTYIHINVDLVCECITYVYVFFLQKCCAIILIRVYMCVHMHVYMQVCLYVYVQWILCMCTYGQQKLCSFFLVPYLKKWHYMYRDGTQWVSLSLSCIYSSLVLWVIKPSFFLVPYLEKWHVVKYMSESFTEVYLFKFQTVVSWKAKFFSQQWHLFCHDF